VENRGELGDVPMALCMLGLNANVVAWLLLLLLQLLLLLPI